MAITYQGAVDTMIACLNTHPETDAHAYADALVELLLNAVRRSLTERGPCRRPLDRTNLWQDFFGT